MIGKSAENPYFAGLKKKWFSEDVLLNLSIDRRNLKLFPAPQPEPWSKPRNMNQLQAQVKGPEHLWQKKALLDKIAFSCSYVFLFQSHIRNIHIHNMFMYIYIYSVCIYIYIHCMYIYWYTLYVYIYTVIYCVYINIVHIHMHMLMAYAYMGLSKNPDINQMVLPRVIVFFFPSYRFSKCWLHTLMKQFIFCFLCGISPYNHQLHICFSGKSLHLQSLLLRTCPINNIYIYIMYMYEHRYHFFFLLSFSRVRTTYS